MLAICQDYFTLGGEHRRRKERMMSRFFTWFTIGGLGEPNILHQSVCFTRNRKDFGECLTCEELVGVTWSFSDSVKN